MKSIRRLIIVFITIIVAFMFLGAVSAIDLNSPIKHSPFDNSTVDCNITMDTGSYVYAGDSQKIVNLNFTNVLTSGNVIIQEVNQDSVPSPSSNFRLNGDDSYYEIHTTSEYSGNITVYINYAGASYVDENTLRLWHYDSNVNGGTWVDCTTSIDTINKIIYGSVTSLSPFAIHQIAGGNNNPPFIPGGSNDNNPFFPGDSGTPIIPITPIDPGNSNGNTQTNNPVNTIISTAGANIVQSVTVNAASNTVEMQKTGLPLIGLILAILAVIGGLSGARRR